MTASIDYSERLIVALPDQNVSVEWDGMELIKSCWSACLVPCKQTDNGGFWHDVKDPDHWTIYVGGFSVSNQPPIYNTPCGSIRTYIVYFDNQDYAKRLAQSALSFWVEEYLDKQERDKDKRIEFLIRKNKALVDEFENLQFRYIEARAELRSRG